MIDKTDSQGSAIVVYSIISCTNEIS